MEKCVQGILTIMGVLPLLMVVIRIVMVTVDRYAYSNSQNDQTIIVF
jgi:hypothetical protein